jgi:CRP/FNR family cyclic AMP-dependent transcriptional regulator
MLTTVEKVVFLQDVDVFARIPLEDLVYVAAITDEIEIAKGREIFREGDISDSMYLVVEGKVRLHRQEIEVLTANAKDVFGTWALFDDETRVVTATALEDCHMLRLDKEKFLDLLTDPHQNCGRYFANHGDPFARTDVPHELAVSQRITV